MQPAIPVCMGSDSLSMVNRAKQMQAFAIAKLNAAEDNGREPRGIELRANIRELEKNGFKCDSQETIDYLEET